MSIDDLSASDFMKAKDAAVRVLEAGKSRGLDGDGAVIAITHAFVTSPADVDEGVEGLKDFRIPTSKQELTNRIVKGLELSKSDAKESVDSTDPSIRHQEQARMDARLKLERDAAKAALTSLGHQYAQQLPAQQTGRA